MYANKLNSKYGNSSNKIYKVEINIYPCISCTNIHSFCRFISITEYVRIYLH